MAAAAAAPPSSRRHSLRSLKEGRYMDPRYAHAKPRETFPSESWVNLDASSGIHHRGFQSEIGGAGRSEKSGIDCFRILQHLVLLPITRVSGSHCRRQASPENRALVILCLDNLSRTMIPWDHQTLPFVFPPSSTKSLPTPLQERDRFKSAKNRLRAAFSTSLGGMLSHLGMYLYPAAMR